MLRISPGIVIPLQEIEFSFVRAQGAGGQNVNKLSTAVHLRFDIMASSLPQNIKEKVLAIKDQRISADGVIIIKAQRFRSQEMNRADALQRLAEVVRKATMTSKTRKATRPTRASQKQRLEQKKKHGRQKALRGKVEI